MLTTINLEETAIFNTAFETIFTKIDRLNEERIFFFSNKFLVIVQRDNVTFTTVGRIDRWSLAAARGCCCLVADSTDVTQPRDKLPSNCTLLHSEINKQENIATYRSSPSTIQQTSSSLLFTMFELTENPPISENEINISHNHITIVLILREKVIII